MDRDEIARLKQEMRSEISALGAEADTDERTGCSHTRDIKALKAELAFVEKEFPVEAPESPETTPRDLTLLESGDDYYENLANRIEDPCALERLIEDPSEESNVDAVANPDVCDSRGIVSGISTEQAKVLRMRFGIGGEREHSHEEIAKELSLPLVEVQDAETKALQLLCSPQRSPRLKKFLDDMAKGV